MLNRFFTPKEMALMTAFTAALLVGAGAMYYSKQQAREQATLGVVRPETQDNRAKENPADTDGARNDSPPVLEAASPRPAGPIGVAVSGAVRREGMYWLDPDARVLDLLTAAGGAEEGAYLEAINRAARLIDGTTLTVPWQDYTAAEGEIGQYRRWSAGLYLNPPEYLNKPWSDHARAQLAASVPSVMSAASAPGAALPATAAAPGCINLNTATLAELETLPGIGPAIGQRILDYRDQHGFQDIRDLMNVGGIAEKRFAAIAHLVCL